MKKILAACGCLVFLFVCLPKVNAIVSEPIFGGQNMIAADLTDSWTTNWYRVNIKTDDGVILTEDNQYAAKVSSSTAGKSTASGIVSFDCTVTAASFTNIGADSTMTSNYWFGTSSLISGMSTNWDFVVPVSTSFWVNMSLGTGSTVYYLLQGAK